MRRLLELLGLRQRRRVPVDWLDHYTGRPASWWVLLVQERINATWRENPENPDHPISQPTVDWMPAIADEVRYRARAHGDENISSAMILGLVLTTWALRISRAKAFDPHRPLELRQLGYAGWVRYCAALNQAQVDESADPAMFEQPWESPWLPDATDGDFV